MLDHLVFDRDFETLKKKGGRGRLKIQNRTSEQTRRNVALLCSCFSLVWNISSNVGESDKHRSGGRLQVLGIKLLSSNICSVFRVFAFLNNSRLNDQR